MDSSSSMDRSRIHPISIGSRAAAATTSSRVSPFSRTGEMVRCDHRRRRAGKECDFETSANDLSVRKSTWEAISSKSSMGNVANGVGASPAAGSQWNVRNWPMVHTTSPSMTHQQPEAWYGREVWASDHSRSRCNRARGFTGTQTTAEI